MFFQKRIMSILMMAKVCSSNEQILGMYLIAISTYHVILMRFRRQSPNIDKEN